MFGRGAVAYPWRIAAITATAVGVIHGLIFFVVRSRERRQRARTITEVRDLSNDLCNKLQAVIFAQQAGREHEMLEAAHAIRRHVAALE
jgi:hypothetical protein